MNPEDDPTIKAAKRIQRAIDQLQMALALLPSDHPIKQDLIGLHRDAQRVARDVRKVWSYRQDRWVASPFI